MTLMMLKWNKQEKGYGCVWGGKWYRRRLPAQQELMFSTKKTTLQFDQSRPDNGNHGWYLLDYPDQKIDGIIVDLPFNPRIVNVVRY